MNTSGRTNRRKKERTEKKQNENTYVRISRSSLNSHFTKNKTYRKTHMPSEGKRERASEQKARVEAAGF